MASVRANQIAQQTPARRELELAARLVHRANALAAHFHNLFHFSNFPIARFL